MSHAPKEQDRIHTSNRTPIWSKVPVGLLLALLAAACSTPSQSEPVHSEDPEPAVPAVAEPAANIDGLELPAQASVKETVYVPVYSHIYFRDGTREFDLAATLSVRNTDPDHEIVIASVRYYDSAGQVVRSYLESPQLLKPLSSSAFVVEERDRSGGVGANFIVEWQAEAAVSSPVIEAVMISTAGTQGISFVSRGRTIRPLNQDQPANPRQNLK